MKMPFSRRSQSVPIPEGVTEAWSGEENAVVVTVPFDASGRDASATADKLSELVVATVNAVQAGEFGHSIPEGVSNASVRIQVDTGTTPLGPLAERSIEILQERLGRAIPLSVHTAPAPPEPEVEVEEPAPDAPRVAPVPRGPEPTAGLVAAPFVWDDENARLRAEIVYLGEPAGDAQTQTDLRKLVELTIASLATPEVRATIPPDAAPDFPMWVTVVVNDDAVGPLTEKMFEDGEEQFENTRVDFVAMAEPREKVIEMQGPR